MLELKDTELLSTLKQRRLYLSKTTKIEKKSELGQFFTPEKTAAFIASIFPDSSETCRLLDAGAGIGSLSAAFLNRWREGEFRFNTIHLDAFEIDSTLITHLQKTLTEFDDRDTFSRTIHEGDFIHAAVDSLTSDFFAKPLGHYTHAILNPPYKKINSNSAHRLALRRVDIETVNLYSAFVALAISLVESGGHIVAIIPRSFCNGPYYRHFREFIFKRAAIRRIHLFESRNKTFKDDTVLQENIIIHLERDARQKSVIISTSTDDTFSNLTTYEHSFNHIVLPNDPESFIHIPTKSESSNIQNYPTICLTPIELGVNISTGPIVDFRMKKYLHKMPNISTVPLLYPNHMKGQNTVWPIEGMKKPNAIEYNTDTKRWLYPTGFYCVVRRFSSKEEKRRIVASLVNPDLFNDVLALGFENHLNILHEDKHGLPELLARGLTIYLNTTAVDEYFRSFNGHTQVNATDLKTMKFPSREALNELGSWAMQQKHLTQEKIDLKLEALFK